MFLDSICYVEKLPDNVEIYNYIGGYKEYYKNNLLHREDGPAVEHPDGQKQYYFEGKLHRIDGPAVIHINGYKEWWINGQFIKREDEN